MRKRKDTDTIRKKDTEKTTVYAHRTDRRRNKFFKFTTPLCKKCMNDKVKTSTPQLDREGLIPPFQALFKDKTPVFYPSRPSPVHRESLFFSS